MVALIEEAHAIKKYWPPLNRSLKAIQLNYGVYHYSNLGAISWYDFAVEIFKQFGKTIEVKPIKTKDYPTAAKRPKYSVLDTTKIKNNFDCTIKDWQGSLNKVIQANLCNKKQR